MAEDTRTLGLEQELNTALEDLRTALQRADDATANLQRLVPRVTQIGALFDEIAAAISTGRQQLGGPSGAGYSRPTLVVPGEPAPAPQMRQDDPWTQLATTFSDADQPHTMRPADHMPPSAASMTSFRLEFDSQPGPLDLRAVDDAVSEHPSVKDVALLDYDGRKATLKVWIDPSSSPSDVQNALIAKATQIFGPDGELTITALDDAA
jgi:hypothetical protein